MTKEKDKEITESSVNKTAAEDIESKETDKAESTPIDHENEKDIIKTKRIKGQKDKTGEKLHKIEEELNTLEDKYLRLYSDFDNYRKRTSKERIELSKTASAEIIESLLTILDDFERAQKAMKNSDDINAVKQGIELIYNKLSDTLKKKGLEEINCIGEIFNTDYHEAITNIPVESEAMKGKIIDQIEKGYLLNGIILRYPKVVVGS